MNLSLGARRFITYGIFLFIATILIGMVIMRYCALSSNVADLGFFMTNFWNMDQEWQRAFHGHIQPLMLLWGRLYSLLPGFLAPIMLVSLQASLLLVSVLAIWRVFGFWPGFAMLLYYPLWVNALFDFHFDHLVIPLLTGFFIACEKRRLTLALIFGMALSFIKGPFALQTSACGLYFWWLSLRNYPKIGKQEIIYGSLLFSFGITAFVFMVNILMPFFANESRSAFGIHSLAFSWLGGSLSEIISTVAYQPSLVMDEIFSRPGKILYLAVVFGLLGFVSLLRPAPLIVALPILMIALLSRLDNYYDFANHYTAGVIIPAIVGFSKGLPVARSFFQTILTKFFASNNSAFLVNSNKFFNILLLTVLIGGHWALASSPISRLFWSNRIYSYGWQAYLQNDRNTMIKNAIESHIPRDSFTSVATQNSVNWYLLAHRHIYTIFPEGITKPFPVIDWSNRTVDDLWIFVRTGFRAPTVTKQIYVDFIILDLKRPWFIGDRGCNWVFKKCLDSVIELEFLSSVEYAKSNYRILIEMDDFIILGHTKK